MAGEAQIGGFPLPPVEVRVTYKVNLAARGPADPKQRKLRLTEIHKRVVVRGPVAPDQAERLRSAAANCPVGNTLATGLTLTETFEIRDPDEAADQ